MGYNLIYSQIAEVIFVEDAYDFGIILQKLRKEKGLTPEQLARKINKESSIISRYEKGLQSPTFDTVKAFAAIFNVSMDYLSGTEKRERISAYNLTDQQLAIVNKLISVFRNGNETSNKKLSPESCQLLGEIVEELSR